jgi:hypothetical protein
MLKEIEIDFSNINDLNQMHEVLKEKFGFPDFYGKNVNALIDCWSELRDIGEVDETMCDFNLEKEDTLLIITKKLSHKKDIIVNHLIVAIEAVNKREISRGNKYSIILCPT